MRRLCLACAPECTPAHGVVLDNNDPGAVAGGFRVDEARPVGSGLRGGPCRDHANQPPRARAAHASAPVPGPHRGQLEAPGRDEPSPYGEGLRCTLRRHDPTPAPQRGRSAAPTEGGGSPWQVAREGAVGSRAGPADFSLAPFLAMTVEEVAARLGYDPRTARRYASTWEGRQHDPRVPRVERRRTAATGRPRYVIDAASFERWLCPNA